jgi:hypothetical protein
MAWYQAARRSGAAAPGSGPIGSAGSRWPDSSRQAEMEAARFCHSARFRGSSGADQVPFADRGG